MAVSAVTILLGFLRSVLLMRLVSPDAFGYVSLALFFMLFLTHFSAFGMDRALVQRPTPTEATFSTHFVLRASFAVVVLLLALVASPFLRRVYADQAIVVDVLLVLLLANVLAASFSTPNGILRRELRFGALAVLNLVSSVAMTISAPLLAYLGAGLWSLVVEQAIGQVIRWIGFWAVLRPWRLSLRFDWMEARSLLGFGSHALLADVVGTLLDRFDDFWVGTAVGATALGHYSRAYEIAQYPERVLATPITNVFFPIYAALQSEKIQVAKAFLRSSGFLIRTGFLIAAVLLAVIPEATLALFGAAWLPIVPIFRLMVVYVILDPLYLNLSYLAIGMGHPGVLSRTRLAQLAIFGITVPAFTHLWGVHGTAVAADVMISCGVFVLLVYACRRLDFSLRELMVWPLVALGVSSAAGLGLAYGIVWEKLWLALIVKGFGVAAAYVAVLAVAEGRVLYQYGEWFIRALWLGLWRRGTRGTTTKGEGA